MSVQPPVFAQLFQSLHPQEFARCANRFPMRRKSKRFSAWDHLLALSFGHLGRRESLRDIVGSLNAAPSALYHMGFRGNITFSNLAYSNARRSPQLFQAVAQILMTKARRLYQASPPHPDLPQVAFALDSSIISLGLASLPWGFYARTGKAALKLHMLLSLQGNVPAWAFITEANFPDMKILGAFTPIPQAFYVMDRGYVDFVLLYRLEKAKAFFVVRSKDHIAFEVIKSSKVSKNSNVQSDQIIRLTSSWSKKKYPALLRRVEFYDAENDNHIAVLTNNFELSAEKIAGLYRKRWQVELFFKWIKQHLRIRDFFGRSENAVRCQIWAAISTYLLVAILKQQLKIRKSLYEMVQILSTRLFEQTPVLTLLSEDSSDAMEQSESHQLQKLLSLND